MPVLLFILWLIFSARVSIDVIIVGLIAVALITIFMAKFTGWSISKDIKFVGKIIPFIGFCLRLIFEVLKANIHMIGIVLSDKPDDRIKPKIVAHKTKLQTATGKVCLANSITLTPGTVTVDVDGDTVYVHAIDAKAEEGLKTNPLERQLVKMEGRVK